MLYGAAITHLPRLRGLQVEPAPVASEAAAGAVVVCRDGARLARSFSQPKTDSRTRDIVFFATPRALPEPRSNNSSTSPGFAAYCSRRSRTGAIHSISASAIKPLHS